MPSRLLSFQPDAAAGGRAGSCTISCCSPWRTRRPCSSPAAWAVDLAVVLLRGAARRGLPATDVFVARGRVLQGGLNPWVHRLLFVALPQFLASGHWSVRGGRWVRDAVAADVVPRALRDDHRPQPQPAFHALARPRRWPPRARRSASSSWRSPRPPGGRPTSRRRPSRVRQAVVAFLVLAERLACRLRRTRVRERLRPSPSRARVKAPITASTWPARVGRCARRRRRAASLCNVRPGRGSRGSTNPAPHSS